MGYGDPTPVQLRAIPPALEGRDVIASAQTGTGKTAAFALPTLQKLGTHGALRCLVLEPTRELAMQVETSMRDLARFTNLTVGSVFGGVGYGAQRAALRDGLDILVATPGRLEDHLQQGTVKLQDIEVLVLDEVDRMLDVGFLAPMKRIIGKCPKDRQTLFFSATLPPEIAELSGWALRDPVRVEIGASRSVTSTVKHGVYITEQSRTFGLLLALLEATDYQSVLIFSRTKHGHRRPPPARQQPLGRRAPREPLAEPAHRGPSRGSSRANTRSWSPPTSPRAASDVAGVSHVINYDIPVHPQGYVHRIGRTGRAAQTGDAFTLVANDEMKKLSAIERFIGQKIERLHLEGTNVPLHGEQLATKKPKIEPRMDGRPNVPGRGGRRHGQGWRRRH